MATKIKVEDLKETTTEERAMFSAVRSHKNTRSFMERVAELQIAKFGLTDTVEEYIQKTSERTAQKYGLKS